MTPRSKRNLKRILREVPARIERKYRKGDAEHSGDLFDVDLLDEAISEALDLIVYLMTLKEKLRVRLSAKNKSSRGKSS